MAMNADITNKLDSLLKAWVIERYKATNSTGTYSNRMLTEFLEEIASWTFQWYSAEDREEMTHQEQNEFDQWLEDNIDRFAEEEEDYRIQEIDQKKVKHILN
jgi:hypothetical protein|tara:strand:+ start:404 stop:709 length:306 start_codon:yes stop_codon:yes gene_type:complete